MQKNVNAILLIIVLALVGWIVIKPKLSTKPVPLSTKEENSPMPISSPATKGAKFTSPTGGSFKQAQQVIKTGKSYTAILHTTAGDITIQLSPDTPITTNNFVFLAQQKFYDGVIFHRVIPGFMIQGGDPTGTGMGDPGYKFANEKFTGEYKRGTVAMANSGPDTNGSQFFIMHADYALPPNYVIFGLTTSGLDVVDKIATARTGESDRPVEPVSIKSIDIAEK